jgi:hypothetical protein
MVLKGRPRCDRKPGCILRLTVVSNGTFRTCRDVRLESVMRGKADVTDLSEFVSSRAALSAALHVWHRINVDPGTGFAGVQLHQICPTGKSVNFCLASGLSVQIFSQKNLACSVGQITATSFGHPALLKRGASRSSRTLGAGCDGRKLREDDAHRCGRRSRVVLISRR